jgi:hypothetical protein
MHNEDGAKIWAASMAARCPINECPDKNKQRLHNKNIKIMVYRKSMAWLIILSRPTRALRGLSILTRGEDQMTMRTKGEGLSPCLLFTSATRGLLTCNETNFFMVQSSPNPWRCILIEQLQVSLYAPHRQCLFSHSHHSPQPAHLSSELPQNPQLSQPLIQFTIHPRPLRIARRYFIHHKQYKWWEQVVLNWIVPSVKGRPFSLWRRGRTREMWWRRSRSYL